MFNSILANKIIPIIESNQCLATKENKELMIDALLQIKHFYTLIRYESQKEYLVQFMEKMKLIKTKRGQIIYEKGVQNEGLYLVLKGNLSLWEPKTQGEINDEISLITKLEKFAKIVSPTDDMKKKIQQTQFQLDFFRKKQDDELFKNQSEQYFLTENICSLKRVKYLQPGDSLNEDCVVSGVKTQYTAMSMDDCYLLFISPRDYLKIFDLEISKLNFIVDVLKKNFGNSNIDSLRRLSYMFKEEVFPYGSMIFHQNDPSHLFMIIKSGSVELSKILYPGENEGSENQTKKKPKEKKKKEIIEQNQGEDNDKPKKKKQQSKYSQDEQDAFDEYQKYYGDDNNDKKNEEEEEELANIPNIKQEENLLQQQKKKRSLKLKQQSVITPMKYIQKVQCIKLGIIGQGEVLGLEDFIKHKQRSFQAQSIAADTLIYYVHKKKIDDIIDLNEDVNLKKQMKQNGIAKIEWYSDQQSKIAKINSVQEKKTEEVAQAQHFKQRFGEDEEVNFKTVVNKLFIDRRTKLLEDMMRKELNNSPAKIKNFPSLNLPSSKNQLPQEIINNDDSPIGKNQKIVFVSNIQTPQELSSGENTNNKNELPKNTPSSFQEYSKQFLSSTNIANSKANIQLFQSQGKIPQFENTEKPSCSLSPERVSSDKLKFKKLQKQELNTQQVEYEQRFRTIMETPKSPNRNLKLNTDPQRSSLQLLDKKIQERYNNLDGNIVNNSSMVLGEELNKQKAKNEKLFLRNYQLETASLSLQQKIQYKIKNNIILSQKYKKYEPECSKGFIETKKMVKILRQNQQSKSTLQGNILKQMREERQNNISMILQKAKNDSQNNSNIQQILNEIDHQPVSQKKINLQLSSLSQIADLSQSLIKIPANNGSHASFLEVDEKEKQGNSVSFPAIIHSISTNHMDIKNILKKNQYQSSKDRNSNLIMKQQMSILEDRINSINHFSSPKNSKQINAFSSAVTQVPQNDESQSHINTHFQQSELISKSNNKIIDSFNDLPDQSYHNNSTILFDKKQNCQLPLINTNQIGSSILLSQKQGLSPQISFSVKMTRKGINQKYHDIYQQNINMPRSNTERHISIDYSTSEQSLITVNKLDVADDLKQRIQDRQKRNSSHIIDENQSNRKLINEKYPSVGRIKQNNNYHDIINSKLYPQSVKNNQNINFQKRQLNKL